MIYSIVTDGTTNIKRDRYVPSRRGSLGVDLEDLLFQLISEALGLPSSEDIVIIKSTSIKPSSGAIPIWRKSEKRTNISKQTKTIQEFKTEQKKKIPFTDKKHHSVSAKNR